MKGRKLMSLLKKLNFALANSVHAVVGAMLILMCFTMFFCKIVEARTIKDFRITLDPGHGGKSPGCVYVYNGVQILEKDLNLKIAKYLKEELENYKTSDDGAVVVKLTHDGSFCPTLEQRVHKDSDIVISIHNNASQRDVKGGCEILVTRSRYNNFYDLEENLARSILKELRNIGLSAVPDVPARVNGGTEIKNGIFRKPSTDGDKYPNGETSDWYGIIRHGIRKNVPAILIEHAYLSVKNDYEKFLSSDEKLKKLAQADARGIVNYYKFKSRK